MNFFTIKLQLISGNVARHRFPKEDKYIELSMFKLLVEITNEMDFE